MWVDNTGFSFENDDGAGFAFYEAKTDQICYVYPNHGSFYCEDENGARTWAIRRVSADNIRIEGANDDPTSANVIANSFSMSGSTFSSLGTPADGRILYCTDCDIPASQGAPCSSSGDRAGAEAHRIRGAWKCY